MVNPRAARLEALVARIDGPRRRQEERAQQFRQQGGLPRGGRVARICRWFRLYWNEICVDCGAEPAARSLGEPPAICLSVCWGCELKRTLGRQGKTLESEGLEHLDPVRELGSVEEAAGWS